jgi:hypothetical protein
MASGTPPSINTKHSGTPTTSNPYQTGKTTPWSKHRSLQMTSNPYQRARPHPGDNKLVPIPAALLGRRMGLQLLGGLGGFPQLPVTKLTPLQAVRAEQHLAKMQGMVRECRPDFGGRSAAVLCRSGLERAGLSESGGGSGAGAACEWSDVRSVSVRWVWTSATAASGSKDRVASGAATASSGA